MDAARADVVVRYEVEVPGRSARAMPHADDIHMVRAAAGLVPLMAIHAGWRPGHLGEPASEPLSSGSDGRSDMKIATAAERPELLEPAWEVTPGHTAPNTTATATS